MVPDFQPLEGEHLSLSVCLKGVPGITEVMKTLALQTAAGEATIGSVSSKAGGCENALREPEPAEVRSGGQVNGGLVLACVLLL